MEILGCHMKPTTSGFDSATGILKAPQLAVCLPPRDPRAAPVKQTNETNHHPPPRVFRGMEDNAVTVA
jgi:hypothetical protein